MNSIFEGRFSDSPYIEMVWRGRTEENYAPVCPADSHWNFLFTERQGQVKVTVEGATTQFVPKLQPKAQTFLVIKFKLGVFMPSLPTNHFLNGDILLPTATRQSFWLKGSTVPLPTFDNAEIFVERLIRENVLVCDPIVASAIQEEPIFWSSRTVRRRFLQATGLTPKTIQQIERAKQASELLEQGQSILEVAHGLGYSDQPHLTRSLRRFIGQTPAQLQA